MNRFAKQILMSIILITLSSSAFAQNFIKLGTSHDDDFWATTGSDFNSTFPSALDFLGANGRNEITSMVLSDSNVADVFSGTFGSFDALVVSESINSINSASATLIADYVNNGGCLITTGDHGSNEDTFLNQVFGYSLNSTSANDGVDTFALQSAASGTAFAGGPASLLATNATALFSGTPGTTIYDGSAGTGVFTVAQGLGNVVALAFDYCCTDTVTTEQNILDWYQVADNSFSQCGLLPATRSIPTMSRFSLIIATLLLTLFGFVAIRRRAQHNKDVHNFSPH